jgi:hypothetical protein
VRTETSTGTRNACFFSDAEIRAMCCAFLKICARLHLHPEPPIMTRVIVERILRRATNHRERGLTDTVAYKIVNLATAGEFDPDRVAFQVSADLGVESDLNARRGLDSRIRSI